MQGQGHAPSGRTGATFEEQLRELGVFALPRCGMAVAGQQWCLSRSSKFLPQRKLAADVATVLCEVCMPGGGLQPGKGLSARTPLPAGPRVCRPTGKGRPPGQELTSKAHVGTHFLKEHCDPMFLKLCSVKCKGSVRY